MKLCAVVRVNGCVKLIVSSFKMSITAVTVYRVQPYFPSKLDGSANDKGYVKGNLCVPISNGPTGPFSPSCGLLPSFKWIVSFT